MDLVADRIKSGDLHLFSLVSNCFIFDPTTNSVFSLPKEDFDLIKSGSIDLKLSEEIKQATQNGFFSSLDDSSFEDTRVFKSLCLIITSKCNFACSYCFEKENSNPPAEPDVMSFEVGQKALDLIIRLSSKRQNIEVDFFGGEPLLFFETVKQIVEYGRAIEPMYKKKFWFSLTTNASLVTEAVVDFLQKENISLILSIDGSEKNHNRYRTYRDGSGTFLETWKGIQKVIDSGHSGYYTRGTYTKVTPDFVNQVLYLFSQGIKQISFEPVVSKDKDIGFTFEDLPKIKKQYEELAEEYIKKKAEKPELAFYHFEVSLEEGACRQKLMTSCGAGVEYLSVSPSGKLYPCHQFDGKKEFELGDVYLGVENKELVEKLRGLTMVTHKEKCKTCWARYLCGGGCLANNLTINGDLEQVYEMGCEIQKIRLESAIYVQTKLKELENHR